MSTTKKIFFAIVLLVAVGSFLQSTVLALSQHFHPRGVPLHSLGVQFQGLKGVFQNIPYAGYYTDKNLEDTLAIAQFEQAQYALAPTVLDLNNTKHRLIIFDCTSPEVAMAKIKELGLQPLKANNGLVLVMNPQVDQ